MRHVFAVAALFALVPSGLTAQDSPPVDTLVYRVDPLIVTATRGPREVSSIPRPVSVVQQRDLVQSIPNTVSDLFRTLPGLDVAGVGVNQGRPQIRGQRGQRILLLSDGMRLNNSRRQSDFGELPALVDVNGVDRVEVVRGPASVLYGSDAIGGVVNIINRVPREEGLHGRASFRYGDAENQRSGSARLFGRFGDVSIRAGGTYREADAYFAPSGSFGNITLADDAVVNDSGTQDQSFDLRLGFGETGNHAFFGKIERYEAENSGFGYVAPELYDPESTAVRITYPFQDYTKLSAGYRGQELGVLADRFEILTYAQDNKRQLNFGIGPFGIGRGATLELSNLNETDIRTLGLRAEARKLAGPEVLLTYGIDVWRDRARGTDENRSTIIGFGPMPMEDVDNRPQLPDATYLSIGAFGQGEVQVGDRLSLIGGARWQHVAARTYETAGLEDQTPADVTDANLVAAINGIYDVTERVSLIASVGRAFRSPNLIERFFDGPTPEGSGYQVRNPELGPETSFNVDLGLRVRNGRVALETFAFRNMIDGGIRIEPLGYEVGGFAAHQNVNVDELLFRGVESSLDAELGSGFSANASFTWMDSESIGGETENGVGETFSTKLTSGLRYEDAADRFWLSGHVRRNGDQKEVDFGADNPVGAIIPAFTVVNLRSGIRVWQTESGMVHRLNIALTNLTNTLYAEFSNVGFFRPEPKRNLTLTWDITF